MYQDRGRWCGLAEGASAGVLLATALDTTKGTQFITYIDPLNGIGNADAGISFGTIFGIFPFKSSDKKDLIWNVLQPGKIFNGQDIAYIPPVQSSLFNQKC